MVSANGRPRVSIVMPCRNEAAYIGPCLNSVLATDYPLDRVEVLVADGRSDDGTREIVERCAARNPCVRLLDNPARITPAALNTAIRAATGDVIIRMDAHGVYPSDYVSRLVDALLETGADNVGGLSKWRRVDELKQLVQFVVLDRACSELKSPYLIVQRNIDISATEIRKRVASGRSIRYLVPRAVEEIIRREKLYRESGT